MSDFFRTDKNFEYYLDLLPEIRCVVIDQMAPDDRCRFTRTSKLCNKEARASKKFIESIDFNVHTSDYMRIFVSFSDAPLYRNCSYTLQFRNDRIRQFMTFTSNWSRDESWFELSDSKTLLEHAHERLKKLLQSYQKMISKFRVESRFPVCAARFNLEIDELSNLKELTVDGTFNNAQFLSKTKLPLKKLYISRDLIDELQMEKIYQVRDILSIPDLRLNNEQFLQLSASEISIHAGELTPEDVHTFIQSWQNNRIEREMRSLNLNARDFIFKVEQVFRLFGDHKYSVLNALDHKLVLKHQFLAGKTATLSGNPVSLQVIFENNIEG